MIPNEHEQEAPPDVLETLNQEAAREEAEAEFEATGLEGHQPDSEEMGRLFRYVRLHNRYRDEIDRVKAQMGAMVRSLESKLRAVEFVHSPACADITRRAVAGGKSRSVKTPFGTAGFRKVGVGLDITEPLLTVESAEKAGQDQFVRVKKEPDKKALLDHFKATGETLPGCEVRPEDDKFYVK